MVLNQLTDGTYPSIAEMVDIIGAVTAIINHDDMPDNGHDIFFGHGALVFRGIGHYAFVEFIAPNISQVIMGGIKK